MTRKNRQPIADPTRRDFLKGAGLIAAGAAVGFPMIVPSSVFGANAPSNRIAVGFIGTGRQVFDHNLRLFIQHDDVQVVAGCDVDAWRMAQFCKKVDETYAAKAESGKFKGCAEVRDWREMIKRDDIDALMISTPDHWHVPQAIAALKAGKHVSCEKPLTISIAEGRRLADTHKASGKVFRLDSEFRSIEGFHRQVELVRNGFIGKLHTIHTGVPNTDVTCPPQPEMPVPAELDYEMWLGPAPAAPYTLNRVHTPKNLRNRPGWMRVRDYCEGLITNWGTHLNDIAQWGNGTDRSGPIEVEAKGTYPPAGNLWNVLLGFEADYKYANGVALHYKAGRPYVRFVGDEGWIEYDYTDRKLTASDPKILKAEIPADGVRFPLRDEKTDFIETIKNGGNTLEDAEVGHRTCSMCQIAHIAIQLGGEQGKKLKWNPETEKFDDEAANKLLERAAWRAPWTVEG